MKVLGENFNISFPEAIFKLEIDFQDDINLEPISKSNKETQVYVF